MGEALLVRERYKIVRVLEAQEDYACAQAVDILDREGRTCLLNLYEKALLKRCIQSFDKLNKCPDFIEMFLEGGTLVTVFRNREGRSIDDVFYIGDDHPWRDRIEYTDQLLHLALSMADLPPEVSCAAMLSENVLVDEASRRISLRFLTVPMEGMTGRELAFLACDQVKKFLRKRISSPYAELEFLNELEWRAIPGVVQLYALWRERRTALIEAYEKLEKKGFIRRWISLVWGRIKWSLGGGKRR